VGDIFPTCLSFTARDSIARRNPSLVACYSAAKAEVLPSVEHCQGKWQNNRAENSHQPTRLREKVMRRFKSAGHAQRFLSVFGIITSFFRVGRHLYKAHGYREVMKTRFAVWEEAIGDQQLLKRRERHDRQFE